MVVGRHHTGKIARGVLGSATGEVESVLLGEEDHEIEVLVPVDEKSDRDAEYVRANDRAV